MSRISVFNSSMTGNSVLRFYLDANTYISSVRQEFGRNFRDLGNEADELFKLMANNEVKLVLSDFFFVEVEKKPA